MAESSSSSNNGSPPLTRIPQDHVFTILLHLPIESILCFSMTCKKMKNLADSDSLWESVCRRDLGNACVERLKGCNHVVWKKLYQQVYELDSVFCRRLLTDTSDGGQSVPTPRASHSLNLVSGCLLLFGGGCSGGKHLDDTWAAYTGNDTTTTLKWQKMNSGIPSGRFSHSCVVIDDHHLILFGGINDCGLRQTDTWLGQLTVHSKHHITMSWRLLNIASISPPPRGAHAACSIGKRSMLIHGGIGPSARRLNDTWILHLSDDLCTGTWQMIVTQPSPPSRSGHTLTHIGGTQTILFGGRGIKYEVQNDVWLFDGASDDEWRWVQLLLEPQGMSLPRVGHSANLIIGRRLLIYGGEDSDRNRRDDFWVLDISSMPCAEMPRPMFLKQNRLWRRLESNGEKPESRSFHGACVDGSGRFLYVYGGMVDGLIQSSGFRFDGESFLMDLLQT